MTVHQSLLAGCIFENFVFSDDTDIIGKEWHSSSEHDFSRSLPACNKAVKAAL